MLTAKSILLRRQKEEYAKFSDKAGLLTQNERTQVYGFDRSTAQKAAWKARKAHKPLDNGGGSGIISHSEYRSNNSFNTAVTNKSIQSVPYVAIEGFTESECRALQNAHKELLKSIIDLPVGTEASATYSMAMQPLGKTIIGELGAGRVNIERHSIPYIGIHSHPDNQTLSYDDLQRYLVNPNMQLLTAVGNKGSCYALQKFDHSDISGFGKFLDETFDNANFDGLTFKQLLDKSTDLSNYNKEKIASELIKCMNTVLERADEYGFKYYR